jgi:hypothetical protein
MLKVCSSSNKLHLFQHLPKYEMPPKNISPANTTDFLDDLQEKGLNSEDFWIDITPNPPTEFGYSKPALYDLLVRLQSLAERKRIDIFIWNLTYEQVDELKGQTPLNKLSFLRD